MKIEKIIKDINGLTTFKDVSDCLSVLLDKVQEHVIGYRKDFNGDWVCVVKNDKSTITYEVMRSFGTSTDYYPKSEIMLFPDGKKLSDMVNDPIMFHNWTKINLT